MRYPENSTTPADSRPALFAQETPHFLDLPGGERAAFRRAVVQEEGAVADALPRPVEVSRLVLDHVEIGIEPS